MSKENMRGGNENGTAYIGSSDFRNDVCPDCHGQNRAAYVSLGCGLLMIVLVFGLGMHSKDAIVETLNVKSIFQASFWYTAAEGAASSSGINWSTIIFILGMMIMVEGMGKAGFFRWLCLEIAKLVKYRTIPVFITFM